MITLEQCKKILNSEKKMYNDEEIKILRAYLYLLAELQLNNERQ